MHRWGLKIASDGEPSTSLKTHISMDDPGIYLQFSWSFSNDEIN